METNFVSLHEPESFENSPTLQGAHLKQQTGRPIKTMCRVPGSHGSLHLDCGTFKAQTTTHCG